MYDHTDKLIDFFGEIEFGADNHSGTVITVAGEMKSINYLKMKNITDCIYVRPTFEKAPYFLLIDDVSKAIATHHKDRPGRLVVETSPGNFQVWVRFDSPLNFNQKKKLIIAAGGDPEATPTNIRWGRCPGYTNRKPLDKVKYQLGPNGERFWVRLVTITEGVTEVANIEILSTPQGGGAAPCDSCHTTTRQHIHKKRISGTGRDESKAEFRAACDMIRKGTLARHAIVNNIANHAFRRSKRPNIDQATRYAEKLVDGAFKSVKETR